METKPETVEINSLKQLFVDDYLIDDRRDLRRTVHRWEKYPGNPVIRGDKPWECGGTYALAYGGAIFDEEEKLFKMWYWSNHERPDGQKKETMLYATSADGIHWEKPNLGLHDYADSRDNNIVMPSEGDNMETYGAIKCPWDPDPNRLYKCCFWEGRPDGSRGVWSATSPDGLRWTKSQQPICPTGGDTVGFFYDSLHNKYVCFVKQLTYRIRSRFQIESDDFVNWTPPRLIMTTDDRDRQPCDLYNNSGFAWGAMCLGWLQVFYHQQDPYESRLVLELIYTRDGKNWHRMPNRDVVLDVGPDSSWDRTNQSQANGAPIIVGDRMYMYYGGRTMYHSPYKGGERYCSIGLGTMRLDGFVSMDASPIGGTLTTKPLIWRGNTLHLNVKSDWGHCRVEFLDMEGNAVDGFGLDDADDMRVDTVDGVISWKGNSDIGVWAGQPTRLRFHLQNAQLYSFWVT